MRQLLTGLSAIVLFAYPFAVYFGIDRFGLNLVGGLLIAALLLRLLVANKTPLKEFKFLAFTTGIVGIVLVTLGVVFKQHGWLKFYPVMVNVCMLGVFALSLRQPQTIIERLARLQEPDLPESGVLYTRKVTLVWCAFFIMNAATALYTCFESIEVWTLYNGLISYLLAGSLFAGEWIVRQFVRKEH
ncbi:septation protein IspZ [Vibrio jasicida]|uniref:COG4648 family protein n=1 Tax=Vibrio jasicida TaxID=766224 RepID=UPI000CE52AB4|nr:septation protein IspZ [Vibrio jasicida]